MDTELDKHQQRVSRLIESWASYNKKMYALPTSTVGIWHVTGEDPNCDYGGSHHQPSLGYFEGTLEDIIHYAVDLPNWVTWGGGGDIKKVEVQKIDFNSTVQRKLRLEEIARLEKKLAELKLQK